jgi:hypothetical protein
LLFSKSEFSCHVKSSLSFCLLVALVIASLFVLLFLPMFFEAASLNTSITSRFWSFVILFAATFLALYLGYGYRIRIESDRQYPDNRALVVQSVGHAVACAIPLETIEKVIPTKYRDLPDELYATPQYGYRGAGLLVYYRLTAKHGDGRGQQRHTWFPLCGDRQLRQWLNIQGDSSHFEEQGD